MVPLLVAVADALAQGLEEFAERGAEGMVYCLSADIRSGSDQMSRDAKGGTGFSSALDSDPGFVDLENIFE